MKIQEMLKATGFKNQALITVGPDELVSAAIKKLVEHDKGALPVCDDQNELVGIITERDIIRKCFVQGAEFINKKITDIMTKQVVIATLDDDLDYAINTMKKEKIRHIPIADGKRVVGIISMRDVLGFRYEETQSESKYMQLLPKRPTFK